MTKSLDFLFCIDGNTEMAKELSSFGSPNFVVDGELVWGVDYLEDAIRRLKLGNFIPQQ